MTDTSVKNEDHLQQLSIPVANLEDVRRAMAILSKFRDTEIDTDMTLISIEVWRPQKQDCMSWVQKKKKKNNKDGLAFIMFKMQHVSLWIWTD